MGYRRDSKSKGAEGQIREIGRNSQQKDCNLIKSWKDLAFDFYLGWDTDGEKSQVLRDNLSG